MQKIHLVRYKYDGLVFQHSLYTILRKCHNHTITPKTNMPQTQHSHSFQHQEICMKNESHQYTKVTSTKQNRTLKMADPVWASTALNTSSNR